MNGDIGLGRKIIDSTQQRDAIHIAVAPVVAGEHLEPGEHVGINADGTAGRGGAPIGIVDPFLRMAIQEGQRFWLFLYPGTITSLRHEWTHPAFEPALARPLSQKEQSKLWIRDFAESVSLAYSVVMDGAREWVESKKRGEWGEYLCFGGLLEGEVVPDEFWIHYENVTGDKVEEDHRGSFFSCSC